MENIVAMNFIGTTPCADVSQRRHQLELDAPVWRYTWLKPVALLSPSLGLYVMYLLLHGAILSRRACRNGLFSLLVLWLLPFCLSKPPNHASDTYEHKSVGFDSKNQDVDVLYKAVSTDVPKMQPPVSEAGETPGVSDTPMEKTTQDASPYLDRYHVIKVSFDRVQTPFIIGLWIFCASLAKIGESDCFQGHRLLQRTTADTNNIKLMLLADCILRFCESINR